MKKSFYASLLLFAFGFPTAFAQEIPGEVLEAVKRLPASQRNSILSKYRQYKSSPSQNGVEASDANRLHLSESKKIMQESNQAHDEPNAFLGKSQSKLEALENLEEIILKDLEENEIELKKFSEAPNQQSSVKESYYLNRKFDLEKSLRETRQVQTSLISSGILNYEKEPSSQLLPFGYEVFNAFPRNKTNYYGSSVSSNSVPSDYKIGPGDFLEIQLYGQKDAQHSVVIGRNGILQFPGIGPLNVLEKGSSFNSLKTLIKERVSEQLGEGVRVSISLSELRHVKVFLSGEFREPGQHLVVAGSSLYNLLLDCGGMTDIASLRSLTLKRNGSPDKVFDLYELLLKGKRTEFSLEEDDVIFLPTVKNRIWIKGNILRPAIYEISPESTLADAIELSGGFSDRALLSSIGLERVNDTGDNLELRTVEFPVDSSMSLQNGDRLDVGAVSESFLRVISLTGEVEHPGAVEWKKGLRISNLLDSRASYKSEADLNYALLRRENELGQVSFYSFSPNKVLSAPSSKDDLILSSRDTLIVLSRSDFSKRNRMIKPLLEDLRFEGKPGLGVPSVRIVGMVHFPSEYPLTPDMTIADLISAAGGMTSSAYTLSSELSRLQYDFNGSNPEAKIDHTNLPSLLAESTLSTKLQSRDVLSIKTIPSWSEENSIMILGEVKFPGSYTFRKNETLKSVFARAGGFTETAFPIGAVFTRKDLIKREDEQKQRLINQLESDLANISLAAGSGQTAVKAKSVADGLLSRLKSVKSKGRLVIDLEDQVSQTKENSIVVRNGDSIFVPSIPFEVSVVGEVQFATSHLFQPNLDIKDYIRRSGGFTANADEGRVFAVKANGSVLTKSNLGWFKSSKGLGMLQPGDVIVVPINLEKGMWLETLTSGTQIVYQLAVAAAAVNSF